MFGCVNTQSTDRHSRSAGPTSVVQLPASPWPSLANAVSLESVSLLLKSKGSAPSQHSLSPIDPDLLHRSKPPPATTTREVTGVCTSTAQTVQF